MSRSRFIIILIVTTGLVGLFAPPGQTANIKQFKVIWNLNDPAENVTGYNLYWKWGADPDFTKKINGGTPIPPDQHTGYIFTHDIEFRSMIQFVLTAVNAAGESGFSNQVNADLKTLPSPPKNLKIIIQMTLEIP